MAYNSAAPVDGRVAVYRIVKFTFLVALVALAIKFFLLDTFPVRTDQMDPAIKDGDRVVVFKTLHVWPFNVFLVPLRKSPVVFANPQTGRKPSCLRVAAVSGDSIVISSGKCLILNRHTSAFSSKSPFEELLPPDYSPRDSMPAYCLPRKGATVSLDSLSLRDFFFAASLIHQENPGDIFRMKPAVFFDGTPADSFVVKDFYLYKGRLDSVPAKFEYDWFFWDRMRDYLVKSNNGKNVQLCFALERNGARMYDYTFKKTGIFLIADDWQKGFDSRYFGPVVSSSVKGRIICVLWSFGKSVEGKSYFRIDRLFKIIK
ncbi:MAG TPA: S26 family signal peptidase [Chitinivibrionales bacterium]|nr:S26 family signal peptidase [Chitinivibrionales bacterium]